MNVQTIVDANFPQPQVASPPTIVMNGVRWETFKALMADVGDGRAWRIAYDKGVLENNIGRMEFASIKTKSACADSRVLTRVGGFCLYSREFHSES
ncbi:hypothetical protein [[Phormidium] sp. LEGE 05292]|uniref:hypothetical protein n=1 Tax=[Phormidium] sp. LEGE 05292 TaxID=767427 RepID=UPI001D1402FC|nr:hypothetical protein [Phormidium sp. LEGE 05292]